MSAIVFAGSAPVNTVGANGGQASTPTWIFRGSVNYETPTFSATFTGRIEAIDRVVALMRAEGMNATVSSIHVNGWFGDYDKLSMAHLLMRERYGLELADERDRCVFVGDSPNDAPMFAYLPNAVGVANVKRFALPSGQSPAYVTPAEAGAGFAQLARLLIDARRVG